MSAATVGGAVRAGVPLRTPLARPEPRTSPLRLVPTRRSSAAKAPFVVVVVALLVAGLLGLLLLNMVVAQGSFQLHSLSKQGRALDLREQELSNQVQLLQAPAVLAQRASSLGMVPGGPPAFLQLPSGKVLGQPTAGVAPVPPPAATTTATTRPAKTPSKTPSKTASATTTP